MENINDKFIKSVLALVDAENEKEITSLADAQSKIVVFSELLALSLLHIKLVDKAMEMMENEKGEK